MVQRDEIANARGWRGGPGDGIRRNRRSFTRDLGLAVLTGQLLPIVAHSVDPRSGGTRRTTDGLVFESSPGLFDHLHELLIPYELLADPPRRGASLTSSESLLHRHVVSLTRAQLVVVKEGGKVIQQASSHTFVLQWPIDPGTNG